MAGNVCFTGIAEVEMRAWAETYPGRVNDRDKGGYTLLCRATKGHYTSLVAWLVDEKGASVHCTTEYGSTPLHFARSPETVSCLLARGADVTALDGWGYTPLMDCAYFTKPSCVERLLKESKAIETIDTQATRSYSSCSVGDTALHLMCKTYYGSLIERTQIIKMLLSAGANPTILNGRQETPLDALRRYAPYKHTSIALLERAMAEPQRTLLLAKARAINDANHDKAKAEEDAQQKVLASAPTFLQGRVREKQQQQQQQQLLGPPLPRVELHSPPATTAHARPGSEEAEEEETKKRHAVLQYVLRVPELGENGGMLGNVFVELMEMMTPRWDPIRRGGVGGEAGGQG